MTAKGAYLTLFLKILSLILKNGVISVKDSAVKVTIAGIAGSLVMNLIMYLIILLGIKTTSPWSIAANIFLTQSYVNTPAGIVIGLIGTVALNIASAIIILFVLNRTGYDYAILKGILSINALSFVTMGLFMPLLKISPHVRNQPLTNYLALGVLTITGIIIAVVLKKLGTEIKQG